MKKNEPLSVHAEPPPEIVREPNHIHYRTGHQLGKGGFAICHRAELFTNEKSTGRIVALKIVKSKMEPPKLAQKFVTELQLHSKLHHPNIVEFFRAFSYESSTYVVLELCENGSLADALRTRHYFTMPEIRRWLIQICGAVKYLHHRNIVHRDLKTGNLFLDKGMNIKVGDFGLAAVLVSKHDIGMRRTTMCGTPNYLAPEILEKGGRGHNEKVDLWAIGIIAYTLAVGKAPFHASKREDIYKKLQNCEYAWPDMSKNHNDISTDLRDLVGSLLVHEDDRPIPDEIVSHCFFKTQFIPDRLDSSYTKVRPTWTNIKPPSAATLQRGYSTSWRDLCKESGVGIWAPGKVFPLNGSKRINSVVKDCEKEMAAGLAPIVPVPRDLVYLPFPERVNIIGHPVNHLSEIVEERESSQEGPQLVEISANHQSSKIPSQMPKAQSRKLKENVEPMEKIVQQIQGQVKRTNSSRKKQQEAMPPPLRPIAAERAYRPRTASHQTQRAQQVEFEPNISRQASREQPVEVKAAASRQPSQRDTTVAPRIAAVRVRQVPKDQQPLSRTMSAPTLHPPVRRARTVRAVTSGDEPPRAKTPPVEVIEISDDVPRTNPVEESTYTDPAVVLARAAKLRDNIASALLGKSSSGRRAPPAQTLPFVSKWVDYARKHGVGYVLEDGSIGCLYNATSRHPVTHVIVRHGYAHLQRVGDDLETVGRIPLEYYVHGDDDRLRSAVVEGDRKRTTGILWAKFGRYMCQQLGQADLEDLPRDNTVSDQTVFVRFYQRLGTVGVWGFSDGSFQFNFPDHTKLVLSADGKYANFTCLAVEAVGYIQEHGVLPLKFIRKREVLSGPLSSLLYGTHGQENLVELSEANLMREKLQYVISVISQWYNGGGLGCYPEDSQRVKWEGPRLEDAGGKKEEWITVGKFGGDGPRS